MKSSSARPGEILSRRLTEVDVTPAELARQLGVPPNRISQVVNGKRRHGQYGAARSKLVRKQAEHNIREAERHAGSGIKQLPTQAMTKQSKHAAAGAQ